MSLVDKTLGFLEKRKHRIETGQLNCIPSPFTRFSNDFIGIEQACYYCVTSFTKGGKSQFTSYTFIYKPLLFCYYSKSDIDLKVIYFPLEETAERIMTRFMSWLLFDFTKGRVRISPRDLRSTTRAVSQEILDLLNTEEIKDILKYFEEHIIFPPEGSTNPTGIYKFCKKYAEDNGVVSYREFEIKDEFGVTKTIKAPDTYAQNNPNEYRLVVIDTINLIDTEKGLSLKQSMDRLSETLAKKLRNIYNYSPVVIQQQAFEQEGNEAFKLGKTRPSVAGLGDSKYTSRDANVVLGLFSPIRFGLREYEGYDITVFRDNIRFLELIVNRDGEMGGLCPLLFDGAVCDFKELPRPNDSTNLERVYTHLRNIRGNANVALLVYSTSINKFKKLFKKWQLLLQF